MFSWLFGRRDPACVDPLSVPQPPPLKIRSTEVMALVVRIRKGHDALHRALREAPPSVRRLLGDSFRRLCGLVAHAYELAEKVDALRARIDSATVAGSPTEGLLSARYAQGAAQLESVAAALEALQREVAEMSAGPSAAEQKLGQVGHEIEHMTELVNALEETTRS